MKGIALIAILLLTIWSDGKAQSQELKFRVIIEEWALFVNNKYTITNSSILIEKHSPIASENENYSMALIKKELLPILEAINNIEIDEFNEDYSECSNTDSDMEYDMIFQIGEKIKEISIYKCKVESIYILVKAINNILPEKYIIGYTDTYFED